MNASVEEKSRFGRWGGPHGSPLTLPELERAVRSTNPTALLLLPRILRRVIKQDRQLTGWGLKVPHRKSYLISREQFFQIVDPAEVALSGEAGLAEKLILIAQPDPEKLATISAGEALVHCWRLLFHARIHEAMDRAASQGTLSPAVVRQRVCQLGTVEFDEIRAVLQHEAFLLPPYDDMQIYVEFAAVYLELRYFAPSLLARYFPALNDLTAVDRLLAQDLDAAHLFQGTRPLGAPDPVDVSATDQWEDEVEDEQTHERVHLTIAPHPNEEKYLRFMRKAEKAASMGNIVRSLTHRARAVQYATGETALRARAAVRTSLDRLLRRLQHALEIPHDELKPWRETLLALVYQTPCGIWTAEARLLYDLQKVCVDYERGIYTVDLVEWALSWGECPIKRPLPSQRDVLMSKHLHSAAARLPVVRLSDNYRRQLSALLRSATQQAEERLRLRFRPRLTDALESVGLVPKNVPERVARNKLVEELLDQIVERGNLAMGDLRDALSRNNLKLPDFARPTDLLHSDQLLRADRRLANSLDGVYRRGPFYLRWMQRLSSLAFGTRTGRLLTRYAAVPFGGSYLALAGLHHVVDMVSGADLVIKTPLSIAALGLFLMALVNVEAFRHGVWQSLKTVGRLVREIVVDPIVTLIHSELVQQILHSRWYTLITRFLVKPMALTVGVYLLLPLEVINTRTSLGIATSVFLAVNLLLNSRMGREAEEVAADWIVQGWHRFGLRILTGLFWLVMDLFKSLLENIERLLYTVDEWLRFRTGETRVSFTVKAVLGLLWFFLTYVIRFCVNVLIEPQINPIKHFPVVTVSHKLLIPCIPALAGVLELTLEKGFAWTVATAIITGIPGVFGFLVWELKENWRLYAANRSQHLRPVVIGHHGETMGRLLKPGFHSGTVPKRFAKLRRAERKARTSGSWRSVRKHLHVLQHVELALHRYVEREMLAILAQHPAWQGVSLKVDAIHLASNRVRIVLGCVQLDGQPLEIAIERESNWLVAGVVQPGWLGQLSTERAQVLANAMAGLYKLAGADLIRQQIEALLPLPGCVYQVIDQELVVSPNPATEGEVRYDIEEGETLHPRLEGSSSPCPAPTLIRGDLVFSAHPIAWPTWIAAWETSGEGTLKPKPLLPMRLLPTPTTPALLTVAAS